MNTQTNTEVRDYLARMRDELSDLPPAEVGEIMDDAEAHVAEVAEELGDASSTAALTGRLGTPQAYARELRAAAGYPDRTATPPPTTTGAVADARFALWSLAAGTAAAFVIGVGAFERELLLALACLCGLVSLVLVFTRRDLVDKAARLPELAAARRALARTDPERLVQSLRGLQPAWWVVRALVVAASGALVFSEPSAILVSLAFGALCLLAGPKSRTDRRWLWISVPASGFALGVLLLILGSLAHRSDGPPTQVSYAPAPVLPTNVYVFDENGRPLTGVHLYDEDGRPLDTSWSGCDEYREDNRYPRPRVVRDENGCREVSGAPFAVVVPTTTTPSGSPSATPAPSVDPSAPQQSAPQQSAPQQSSPVVPSVVPTG
ncbi:HAAS signaling domain-containing protein [Saccharothrix yanglingensis]|uniref:Proline-rich protein n=1 Tax=Saccharothrix yanglingensis TaxID=659496 RepID=A0ABU0X6S6_9PSEU|nr:hypothetical protein [Saccharothrix yanglingensis]MDQ2587327.1 hypothetical protein [Saccharothrix yanglingensis]